MQLDFAKFVFLRFGNSLFKKRLRLKQNNGGWLLVTGEFASAANENHKTQLRKKDKIHFS